MVRFFKKGSGKSKRGLDDASVISTQQFKVEAAPSATPPPEIATPPPAAPVAPPAPVAAPPAPASAPPTPEPTAPAPVAAAAAAPEIVEVESTSKRSVASKSKSRPSSSRNKESQRSMKSSKKLAEKLANEKLANEKSMSESSSKRSGKNVVEERYVNDDGNESRDEIYEGREECDPHSEEVEEEELEAAPSADEQMSVDEVVSMGTSTVETYEDEETDIATRESVESYDNTNEITQNETYDGSVAASEAVGNQKKFFHKDVVLHNVAENGSGDNLVIRAMYFVPKPKNVDHVVVRIEASTVSARDVMYCRGVGLEKKLLPFVPGFEVIGTIQTLGENAKVDGLFKEGDRVAGISNVGGGNSRFISLPASRLTKISPNVKSTSAVCLIHDYMAAFKALRIAKRAGSPFTGMNILVTDGFSPVGQAVISLASLEGANIYCTADESKHSYLSSLGAKCFDSAPETWLPSASGTFDVVIDNTCIDSYSSSWFALNQKGILVCLSPIYTFDHSYEGGCGIIDFRELHNKWAALKAKYMMTQTAFLDTLRDCEDNFEQYKQDLRYLTFLLEKGEINPKIAEKISLEDVPDAQRLLKTGRANGTIVCVPWIEG